MKKITLVMILTIVVSITFCQTPTIAVRFADTIIKRYANIDYLTGKGWEYSNAIVLVGMEKVFNKTSDPKYYNYVRDFISYYVDTTAAANPFKNMNTFKVSSTTPTTTTGYTTSATTRYPDKSLDQAHPGINVLFLYEKTTNATTKANYKKIADTIRNIYVGASARYPKTVVENLYWHKASGYDNIVMLDGVYMIHPFLAKYGSMFNDNAAIDTAVNQTLSVYNKLYQSGTKLIKHAWYGNTSSPPAWSSGAPGVSTSVWSRGMGWFTMALVEILKYVPASHPKRAQLITALQNLADGIKNYQDPTSKLWYQVVDKGTSLSGNYIETSGSAMFIYTLRTAIDSGWISAATYLPVVQNAWAGIQSATFLTTYSGTVNGINNGPQIKSFAPAMGVQDPIISDAGYLTKPKVDAPSTTNPHAYAAILMAASAMEYSLSTLPVKFVNVSAKQFSDHITVNWKNEDDTEVDYYEIERKEKGGQFLTAGKIYSTQKETYEWDDYTSIITDISYRIKAVSKNGEIVFSNVLIVRNIRPSVSDMVISPNPVRGNIANLSVSNITPGIYKIAIVSFDGKKLFEITEKISGYSFSTLLSIDKKLSKGVYYLRLEGDQQKLIKKIIVIE